MLWDTPAGRVSPPRRAVTGSGLSVLSSRSRRCSGTPRRLPIVPATCRKPKMATPPSFSIVPGDLQSRKPRICTCRLEPPPPSDRSRRRSSKPRRLPIVPGDMRAGNGFHNQCAHWWRKQFLKSASRPKPKGFQASAAPRFHASKYPQGDFDAIRAERREAGFGAIVSGPPGNPSGFQARAGLTRWKAAKRIFSATGRAGLPRLAKDQVLCQPPR